MAATTAADAAETTTISSSAAATPWVERYRPKSLGDVSHQKEVVATLQNAVATGRLPHLLLYGPPGSGKTSVALALCRQLWHPSIWRRRVLELNASDERGISVVRDKIKHFASLAVGGTTTTATNNKKKKKGTSGSGSSSGKQQSAASFFRKKKEDNDETDDKMDEDRGGGDNNGDNDAVADNETGAAAAAMDVDDDDEENFPNPPFKIIILDEADTVTPDAQAALRRIIEAHSKVTRFVLICNYVTRIIEPLASRCAKFRFQALPAASMKERLLTIADSEGVGERVRDVMDDILEQADGDMRRAVTTMQSVHALASGASGAKVAIDPDAIAEISGLPPPRLVLSLWERIKDAGTNNNNRSNGNHHKSPFDSMHRAVEEVCCYSGYSAQILLSCILPLMQNESALNELSKAALAIRMAEAEKKMIDGADEYLQLMTVCSLALECFEKSSTGGCSKDD